MGQQAFKVLLAAKMMEHDPNAFPDVDPTHLRVREFASNDPKWVGAIFMDAQVCGQISRRPSFPALAPPPPL